MRKLIFVNAVADIGAARYMVLMPLLDAEKGTVLVGAAECNADIPELMQKFQTGKLNVLIIPRQFAQGWFVRGDDIEIEFAENFPYGPVREQALARVRSDNLEK